MNSAVPLTAPRPPLIRRAAARAAIAAARLLACLPPRRIVAVLHLIRHGSAPATHAQALRARNDIVATSRRCAGRYCLQRSLATVLLCRMRGTWPRWCTGVRTPPFAAHAWVEAEGRQVGEPADTVTFQVILDVSHPRRDPMRDPEVTA
ncbi:lasso peptide biosynthesis B2 protein [Nonomuraea purpurea]|uniref:Lasso peptide biosynthesis B2 protein n=1 Tax=Nonomuraea purpurea TaxID=1849276 RepID=A0ABV8GQH6_9ACTN